MCQDVQAAAVKTNNRVEKDPSDDAVSGGKDVQPYIGVIGTARGGQADINALFYQCSKFNYLYTLESYTLTSPSRHVVVQPVLPHRNTSQCP